MPDERTGEQRKVVCYFDSGLDGPSRWSDRAAPTLRHVKFAARRTSSHFWRNTSSAILSTDAPSSHFGGSFSIGLP
jgi:hypothetical protein